MSAQVLLLYLLVYAVRKSRRWAAGVEEVVVSYLVGNLALILRFISHCTYYMLQPNRRTLRL